MNFVSFQQESESKQRVAKSRPPERKPRVSIPATKQIPPADFGGIDPQLTSLAEARRSSEILAAFMACDPLNFSPEVQLRFQNEVATKITKLTIDSLMKRQRDPSEGDLSPISKAARTDQIQQEDAKPKITELEN